MAGVLHIRITCILDQTSYGIDAATGSTLFASIEVGEMLALVGHVKVQCILNINV